jgi:hypothetical protein
MPIEVALATARAHRESKPERISFKRVPFLYGAKCFHICSSIATPTEPAHMNPSPNSAKICRRRVHLVWGNLREKMKQTRLARSKPKKRLTLGQRNALAIVEPSNTASITRPLGDGSQWLRAFFTVPSAFLRQIKVRLTTRSLHTCYTFFYYACTCCCSTTC